MPMPPPRASTAGTPGGNVKREIDQLVRALRSEGPQGKAELETLVGARFWEQGKFSRALDRAVSRGRIKQLPDGRLEATAKARS